MGVLLSGHYGQPPEAESGRLTLQQCMIRLGMKPTDFVSEGEPDFFNKRYGAKGRYLLFRAETEEVKGSPVWRAGYYLLPLDAIDVLAAFERKGDSGANAITGDKILAVEVESKASVPEDILARAKTWGNSSQPLFFTCKCDHLELYLTAPWGLRRRWKAKLRCPDRCQPPLTTQI